MSHDLETSASGLTPSGTPPLPKATLKAKQEPRPFWRRNWIIPLVVVVLAFLAYIWPPYLALDPSKALITLDPHAPIHYALLVLHISFGTIALLTLCIQVWPYFRRHHPKVHRWAGRVYVFGGALPSGILAMAITPLASDPTIGTTMGGVFWLFTTVAGYRFARRREYLKHRRWMLYSFAFAMNIIWGRIFAVIFTVFNVTSPTLWAQIGTTAPWVGWVVNIFVVQWWLNRTADKSLKELIGR
jgi:uncharacterized membrane protein YozB (DUF420 family)